MRARSVSAPSFWGKRSALVTRCSTLAVKGMAVRAPVAASKRTILPSAVATRDFPSGIQA
jgi:hypothetical protein